MKSVSICVLIVAFFGAFSNPAAQLSVAHIACVQYSGPSTPCGSDGFNNNPYGTYGFVIAQGYNVPGDGGGGTFANMGRCSSIALPPNGGTIVQDASSSPYCFQRLDPNWGPKEYGAVGKNVTTGAVTDDNVQLQAWLNAAQPHLGDADTYGTSVQLQCGPPDTTIQGPESLDGALFEIMAVPVHGGSTFSASGTEVIDAKGNCRLSGVAINAAGLSNGTSFINTVLADGNHVTIDGFSVLENGNDNLVCDGKYRKRTAVYAAWSSVSDAFQFQGRSSAMRLIG